MKTFESSRRKEAREIAAEALLNVNDKSAVPLLIEEIEKIFRNTSDSELFSHPTSPWELHLGVYALTLGKIGDKKATPFLIKTLQSQNATEDFKYMFCPYFLVYYGSAHIMPDSVILGGRLGTFKFRRIEYSKDGSIARIWEVMAWQGCVAKALGLIGDSAAVPILTSAMTEQLKSGNKVSRKYPPDLRIFAAEALGNIGNESALSALFEVIQDEEFHPGNPELRWSAIRDSWQNW